MRRGRRQVSGGIVYFVFQGMATLAWWAVIAASPALRRWFAFGDDGASLLPFLPADVLFWCLGSLAAAWGAWTGAVWTAAERWMLVGAMCGSLLHAAAAAAQAGAGWAGVLAMVPACLTTGWFAWHSPASAD